MDTLTPDAVLTSPALTMADRCDRCGAQAYLRVTMPSGAELLLCGHHGNANRPALIGAGARIQDETDKLTIKRESSAA